MTDSKAKQYCIEHDKQFKIYLKTKGWSSWEIEYRYMAYNPHIETFYKENKHD